MRWTKKGGALNPGSSHHCLLACRIVAIPRTITSPSSSHHHYSQGHLSVLRNHYRSKKNTMPGRLAEEMLTSWRGQAGQFGSASCLGQNIG